MTKRKQVDRRAPAPSDNAQRYLQWRNTHRFWRDHPEELDRMLDAQIAETQRRKIAEAR